MRCTYNDYFSQDQNKIEYLKRESKENDDRLAIGITVPWTSSIVSVRGAHYHFWIDRKLEKNTIALKHRLKDCVTAATFHGDPVMCTYSWIPTFEPLGILKANEGDFYIYDCDDGCIIYNFVANSQPKVLKEPMMSKLAIGPDGYGYFTHNNILLCVDDIEPIKEEN